MQENHSEETYSEVLVEKFTVDSFKKLSRQSLTNVFPAAQNFR